MSSIPTLSVDRRIEESGGTSYRRSSHKVRSADRGSSTISDVVPKRIVALHESSYLDQPGSPLLAKATQAACMVSVSHCGALGPSSGSVPLPSASKTKGISIS